MKRLVICVALIFVGLGQSSYGCTLMGKTLSRFDDSEYVFIGKVAGYTMPVGFDEKRANNSVEPLSYTHVDQSKKAPMETVGLVVKVLESVYLPKTPTENFEIFLFDLMADCSIRGKTVEDLMRLFPTGLEIRVVAKQSEFVERSSGQKNLRLEVRPSEPNSIISNVEKNGSRLTSSSSVFSYKDYTYDMDSDSDSKYLLPAFEARKDLLRLERAETQPDRNSILDRIFHAPPNSDLDMGGLFDSYAGGQAEADRYFESYLKATSPETFAEYKVFKQALDELIKRGFDKKAAEEAIGKALSEGTDFDSSKLMERVVEILGSSKPKPKPNP